VSLGNEFLLGAIATMALLAGLFFLRFWRQTGDRLFLLFAAAFGLEGLSRAALASAEHPNEGRPLFYAIRLASYLIIVVAVVQKNLARGR
jgi:hypothetical protein